MKTQYIPKIFMGLFSLTFASFVVATYAIKKTTETDPQVWEKIGKKFNLQITTSGSGFYISDEGSYESVQKTWDLRGNMSKIFLSTTAANVTFENSPDDQFHITAEGLIDKKRSADLFDVSAHGDEISITDNKNRTRDVALKVMIPKNQIKDFEVKSVSGNLRFRQIQAEKLELETVSGNAAFDDIAIEKLEAKTTSGSLQVSSKIPSHLDVRSISGDIQITAPEVEKAFLTAKSVSGNILNAYKGSTEGKFTINAKSVSGDVEIKSYSF